MSVALLLALWSWDACPGEQPIAWRVEWAVRMPVAYIGGVDDEGQPLLMPVYNPWQTMLLQQGPEMQAEVPCEPAIGEVCVTIVTGVDEADNADEGTDCS